MKRTVRDLLTTKDVGRFAYLQADQPVYDAVTALREYGDAAVLIRNKRGFCGIFTERDLLNQLQHSPYRVFVKPLDEVMSTEVVYATMDFTLEDCLLVMSRFNIRHLPILDGREPLALLSIQHITDVLVEDQKHRVDELINYITGYGVQPVRESHEPQVLKYAQN